MAVVVVSFFYDAHLIIILNFLQLLPLSLLLLLLLWVWSMPSLTSAEDGLSFSTVDTDSLVHNIIGAVVLMLSSDFY